MWRVWAILFRWQYVALLDHDMEMTISRVRTDALGRKWAYRWWAIGRKVWLLQGGEIKGPSYVVRWELL